MRHLIKLFFMILFASSAVASDELTKYVYEKFDLKNASKYTISTGYAHKGACVFNGSFYFTNIDGTPTSINLYKKMVHWVDMDRHTEIKNNFVRFGKFPAPEQLFELIHKDDELIFRMQTPHNGSTLVCDLPFRKVGLDTLEVMKSETKNEYFENGQLKSEKNYKDNKLDGQATKWFENGQIMVLVNFKEGNLHGQSTEWYENGQIKFKGIYKDGNYDGRWTSWYENGQMLGFANFKNNLDHGKSVQWYENGMKMHEMNKKNGKLDGTLTKFFENGQIMELVNFKEGNLHGKFTKWYENGQIESRMDMVNGNCISGC